MQYSAVISLLMSRTVCTMQSPCSIAKQTQAIYVNAHIWLKTYNCGMQNNLHVSAGPVLV
jgi:hypothetical protein